VLKEPGGVDRDVIGRAVTRGLEQGAERPAFLVPDSGVQAMVQESLLIAGRRPGVDVSVLGTGEDGPQQIVPLTTIDFVPPVVSTRAVDLLIGELDGNRPLDGAVHLVQPVITERASTLPL